MTFLFVKPPGEEEEWLAMVAAEDENGDGWMCAGVHEHVNPLSHEVRKVHLNVCIRKARTYWFGAPLRISSSKPAPL